MQASLVSFRVFTHAEPMVGRTIRVTLLVGVGDHIQTLIYYPISELKGQ
jgi:hypothetical protein